MDKDDNIMFIEFINNRIREINRGIMLYEQLKNDNCKDKAVENENEIKKQFEDYIYNRYRTKNDSYIDLIEFIRTNYPKVKYREIKEHVCSNRSIYYKTLQELIEIYIHKRCDIAMHKRLIKNANRIVDERDKKRIKYN